VIEAFFEYFQILSFFALLVIGYVVGSYLENRHFASIQERETAFAAYPTVSTKRVPEDLRVVDSFLVSGEVVISIDYFKAFLAFFQNLVGWNVTAYETLLDRARREAILRMKETAFRQYGADMIINARIETSSIAGKESGKKRNVAGVELYAYGTALKLSK
jgi:uncharacterized protein YbjQ (UPF0145 family)